ncbi:MAG: hypothetical protein COA36_01995 [Desulfotalea sp.]|nr:MAG: hypothetical protein COA36_01995 [Desulfotalea sp.]
MFFAESYSVALVVALVGGLIVFLGGRSGLFAPLILGLLCQLGGLYIFLDAVWYPFSSSMFWNCHFLGWSVLAVAAFVSAYSLDVAQENGGRIRLYSLLSPVFFWMGSIGWCLGVFREIQMHIFSMDRLNGLLLAISATSILAGVIAEKINWTRLNAILFLQLPALLFCAVTTYWAYPDAHLFVGLGAIAWGVAFFVQLRILSLFNGVVSKTHNRIRHLLTLVLLLFMVAQGVGVRATLVSGISRGEGYVVAGTVGFVIFCVLVVMVKKGYLLTKRNL